MNRMIERIGARTGISGRGVCGFLAALGLACASAVMLCGCVDAEGDKSSMNKSWTAIATDSAWGTTGYKVVEIEGHRYVVMRGIECVGIVHAESCPCRKARD